jgi:hypothetical protein
VTQRDLFLIGDVPGFTPQIGRLVSMMNYARSTTIGAVAGLGVDVDLGERARNEIRGHELDHYMDSLAQVRAKTLVELGQRDDRWLEEETSFGSGQRVNNYFKWFHVMGREINHRGQIRWLRTRATKRP